MTADPLISVIVAAHGFIRDADDCLYSVLDSELNTDDSEARLKLSEAVEAAQALRTYLESNYRILGESAFYEGSD
jgi:hypothetical protein